MPRRLAWIALVAALSGCGASTTSRVAGTPGEIVFTRSSDPGGIALVTVGRAPAAVAASALFEGGLTVAPDGRIAFTRSRPPEELVLVARADGSRPREVFRTASLGGARFSPDGTHLLAWGRTTVGADVAVIDRTTRRFRIPCQGTLEWSPDGARIACIGPPGRVLVFAPTGRRLATLRGLGVLWVSPNRLALVVGPSATELLDARGSSVARLRGTPLAASPDGRLLALGRAGRLTVVRAADAATVRTIDGPRDWTAVIGTFTPDGRELAYVAADDTERLVDVATGRTRTLPSVGTWSRDSTRYAFTRLRADGRVDVLIGDRYARGARRAGSFDYDDHGDGSLLPAGGDRFYYQWSVRVHRSLWSVGADGTGLRRLTRDGDVGGPAWSADGKRLAFGYATMSGGNCGWCSARVAIAAPTGRILWTVSDPEFVEDMNPTWSPDGRRIAAEHGFGGQLALFDPGGGHFRVFAENGFSPAWSPDGKKIAYSWSGAILLWTVAGGAGRVLVADGSAPAWSPDGASLAFVRDGSVRLIDLGAPDRDRLVLRSAAAPSFSPDGKSLVVARAHGLWTVGVDGSGPRRVTSTAYVDGEPAWRPGAR